MKKILHDDFAQQRRKEKSLLPLDVSWLIWHTVKVGGCVYQEVFKKQLLIIKV